MKSMTLALILCAATPVAFAAEPNSQDCKQFMSGTWTSKPGDDGKAISVTYDVGGVYRQDSGAANDQTAAETGSWDAQPTTPPGGCDLNLTPTGGKPRIFTLKIVDNNTVEAEDGTVSTRTEGSMEQHSAP